MKKRFIVITVILSLLIALTACNTGTKPSQSPGPDGNQKSAQEVVKMLNSKLDTKGDIEFDVDYNMSVKMDAAGLSMDMKVDGNMKCKTVDGKPQYNMTMKTNFMGQDMDAFMAMADGKVYYEVNGEPMEMEIGEAEAEFEQSINTNITEDAIKDFKVKKEGNNYVYEITIDHEKLNDEFFKEYLQEEELSGAELSFTECKAIVTLDSAYNPLKYDMVMKFTAKVDGQEIKYDFNIAMVFKSFENVQIDLSKLSA